MALTLMHRPFRMGLDLTDTTKLPKQGSELVQKSEWASLCRHALRIQTIRALTIKEGRFALRIIESV